MKSWFKRLLAIASGSLLTFTAVIVTVTYTWIVNSDLISDKTLNGQTAGAYFAGGDGTEANPYIINRGIHMYNLAWLQYLGTFNQTTTGTDGNPTYTQTYFAIDPALEGELDMSSYTIPPIGTERYPFIGSFDGNGKTVSNLNVDNITGSSNIDRKPSAVGTTLSDVNIVGMFGVIGNYSYTDTNGNLVGIDSSAYNSITPSVSDFYLKNATINSNVRSTLIGVLAGYVSGGEDTISNVGVTTIDDETTTDEEASSINVLSGATAYTAGTGLTSESSLSQYGTVGYATDEAKNLNKQVTTDMYEPISAESGGTGEDSGWGGSIDMQSLYTRLDSFRSSASYRTDLGVRTSSSVSTTDGGTINTSMTTPSTLYYPEDAIKEYSSASDTGGGHVTFSMEKAPNRSTKTDGSDTIYLYGGEEFKTDTVGETMGTAKGCIMGSSDNFFSIDYTSNQVVTRKVSNDASSNPYESFYWGIDRGTATSSVSSTVPMWFFEDAETGEIGLPSSYDAVKTAAQKDSSWLSRTYNKHAGYMKKFYIYWQDAQGMNHYLSPGKIIQKSGSGDNVRYQYDLITTTKKQLWQVLLYQDQDGTYTYTERGTTYTNSGGMRAHLFAFRPNENRYNWINTHTSGKYIINTNSTGNIQIYLFDGVPHYSHSEQSQSTKRTTGDTYIPLNVNTSADQGTLYAARSNNTGYIVSSSDFHATDYNETDGTSNVESDRKDFTNVGGTWPYRSGAIQVNKSAISNISTSLNGGNSYTGSNLWVATPSDPADTTKSFVLIGDDRNKGTSSSASVGGYSVGDVELQKYYDSPTAATTQEDGARYGLEQMLASSGDYIYGMNFQGQQNADNAEYSGVTDFEGTTSSSKAEAIVTVNDILLNGTKYGDDNDDKYELVKNSIDCNLYESGYINFFAGSYLTGNSAFFSLHHVTRSGNTITSVKKISEIYGTGKSSDPYIYLYVDGTYSNDSTLPSGYSLIFDTDWIDSYSTTSADGLWSTDSKWTDNMVYYFEIPVNAGEYAIGSVQDANGAYLLYLDISANGASGTVSRVITEYKVETTMYFDYPLGVAIVVSTSELIDPKKAATVTLASGVTATSGTTVSLVLSKTTTETGATDEATGKTIYGSGTVTAETNATSTDPLSSSFVGQGYTLVDGSNATIASPSSTEVITQTVINYMSDNTYSTTVTTNAESSEVVLPSDASLMTTFEYEFASGDAVTIEVKRTLGTVDNVINVTAYAISITYVPSTEGDTLDVDFTYKAGSVTITVNGTAIGTIETGGTPYTVTVPGSSSSGS